ncbi:MAG: hypothetical protein J1E95_05660, partial [Muribaculaceae bacterium]|nr:hypothetical protein [Muribaculaceae bacterium]
MKTYFLKYIKTLMAVFTINCFTACVDDKLTTPDEPQGGLQYDPIEGYSIGFTVDLEKDMSTRAEGDNEYEAYDNYIDTKDKFRVLFFTANGEFMFGAIDRTVTYLTDQNDYTKDRWYVRIPMNYLVDRQGKEYNAEKIRKDLKENSFKVAILANWPNNGVLKDEDDPNSDFTYINREPNWGLAESIYGTDQPKTIHDLHHLVVDGGYNDNNSNPSRRGTYGFVMGGDISNGKGTMGVKTDWVRDIIDFSESSGSTAREKGEAWIKKYWDPSTRIPNSEYKGKDNFDPHYDNLWQLWDFNADQHNWEPASYAFKDFGELSELQAENWKKRMNSFTGGLSNFNPDKGSVVRKSNTSPVNMKFGSNNLGLVYNGSLCASDNKEDSGPVEISTSNSWALRMRPVTGKVNGNNGKETIDIKADDDQNLVKNYIKFKAPGSGTIRIKFSKLQTTTNKTPYLVVQHETNHLDKFECKSAAEPHIESINLDVQGETENIFIFALDENIAIHAIEYISSRYFYDTNRIGIAPSKDYPIPMYGVEDFSPLTAWEEGTTFDISLDNRTTEKDESKKYEGKNICLIRSLAKMVVYLPNKAEHLYVRSMNRTAWCEPIDVFTPTSQTWSNAHGTNSNSCEFWKIIDYNQKNSYKTSFHEYTGTEGMKERNLSQYQDWLSWFYSSWLSWGWNLGHSPQGYYSSEVPHLFNPNINRSDFCQMLDAGEVPGRGHKYILYMPEKNISD